MSDKKHSRESSNSIETEAERDEAIMAWMRKWAPKMEGTDAEMELLETIDRMFRHCICATKESVE